MGLKKIEDQIKACKKCSLHKTRINTVPGTGNPNANIMLIGEAPGSNEDKQGKPFVGRAGKVLDEVLESAGISRDDIFIANILKCRPPNNRDPAKEEIKSCTPYLDNQISIIKPKILCPLGNHATRFIMKKFNLEKELVGITKLHGKVFNVSTLFGNLKIIPMFHPAVATYDPRKTDTLKEDFKYILKKL